MQATYVLVSLRLRVFRVVSKRENGGTPPRRSIVRDEMKVVKRGRAGGVERRGRLLCVVYGLIMYVNISPMMIPRSGVNEVTTKGWRAEGENDGRERGRGFTRASLNALYTSSTP